MKNNNRIFAGILAFCLIFTMLAGLSVTAYAESENQEEIQEQTTSPVSGEQLINALRNQVYISGSEGTIAYEKGEDLYITVSNGNGYFYNLDALLDKLEAGESGYTCTIPVGFNDDNKKLSFLIDGGICRKIEFANPDSGMCYIFECVSTDQLMSEDTMFSMLDNEYTGKDVMGVKLNVTCDKANRSIQVDNGVFTKTYAQFGVVVKTHNSSGGERLLAVCQNNKFDFVLKMDVLSGRIYKISSLSEVCEAVKEHVHSYGDTGEARYTCTGCSEVDTARKTAAEAADAEAANRKALEEAIAAAEKEIEEAVSGETEVTVLNAAETAKQNIRNASTVVEVNAAKEEGLKKIQAAKAALIAASTEPAPTEPAPTEPAPTEPAPTEPASTEPAPTEPAPTEPAPTEPAPTEPAPTKPAPTEPAPTAPAPTKPAPTDPTPTKPVSTSTVPTTTKPTTPAPTTKPVQKSEPTKVTAPSAPVKEEKVPEMEEISVAEPEQQETQEETPIGAGTVIGTAAAAITVGAGAAYPLWLPKIRKWK